MNSVENNFEYGILGKEALVVYKKIIEKYDLQKKLNLEESSILTMIFMVSAYYDVLHLEEDEWVNGKDIAEIILLLKTGNNIQLSADIPHSVPQTIKIEKGFLKDALVKTLTSYFFDRFGELYSSLGWIEATDAENVSDNELQEVISKEKLSEETRIKSKGRSEKYIPRIGAFVCSMLKEYNQVVFSKLTKSEAYCLLGDFLCMCGNVPSYSPSEWDILTKKEKKKIVEGWIKSYEKNLDYK